MTNPLRSITCVFLDRDGVINVKLPSGRYITEPEGVELCPGAAAAIARLNRLGLKTLVVTNQRGISLGLFSVEHLERVHARLQHLLAAEGAHLDGIYVCPHARDTCDCRKPLPGMFLQALRDFPAASPVNSLMVGDSLSDIEAGHHLGMTTVFIEGVVETQDPGADQARSLADYQAATLDAFVRKYF